MSKWGDFIARTAVRKVVYLVVGAIIAALVAWASPAHAQAGTTRADAWARCLEYKATVGPGDWRCGNYPDFGPKSYSVLWPNGALVGGNFQWTEDCPASTPWDEAQGRCNDPTRCQKAPNVAAGAASGSAPICVDGCSYVPDKSAGTSVGYDGPDGNSIFSAANSWKPNGVECSAENHPMPWDPQKPTCQTVPGSGGHHCTMPNGTNCVTTAQGRRLCWQPDETGPRMTQDGKEGADRQPFGTDTKPPPNMQNPQPAGSVTNTTNDNRTTTTIFNGGGNSGGQGNAGQGGNDGSGDGQGEGDGEGDEAGGAGGDIPTLYEGSGRTPTDAFNDFKVAAANTPVIAAATDFFQVSTSGGSCPIWTVPASDWLPAMTFDFLCTGALQALLALAGYIIMAVAAFHAWHLFAGD